MGEVIQLKSNSNEIRASLPIKREKICLHKYVEVDIDEHELRCTQCDARIDPFEFVLSLAHEERNQIWTLKELKKQVEIFKKEKDQLQKDVANLKAQKRRLA
jgi:hypothetical protein